MFFLLLEKLNYMLRVKVLVECGGGRGAQGPSISLLGYFQADGVGQV